MAGSRDDWRDILGDPNIQLMLVLANALPVGMFSTTPLMSAGVTPDCKQGIEKAYKQMYDSYAESTLGQQKELAGKTIHKVEWKDLMSVRGDPRNE